MSKKKIKEAFVQEANLVHNHKYTYDKLVYANSWSYNQKLWMNS